MNRPFWQRRFRFAAVAACVALGLALGAPSAMAILGFGGKAPKPKQPKIQSTKGKKAPAQRQDAADIDQVVKEALLYKGRSPLFTQLEMAAAVKPGNVNRAAISASQQRLQNLKDRLGRRVAYNYAQQGGSTGMARRILQNQKSANPNADVLGEFNFHLDHCAIGSDAHRMLAATKVRVRREQDGAEGLLNDLMDSNGRVDTRKLQHLRVASEYLAQDSTINDFSRRVYAQARMADRGSYLRESLGRSNIAGDTRSPHIVAAGELRAMSPSAQQRLIQEYVRVARALPGNHIIGQHARGVLAQMGVNPEAQAAPRPSAPVAPAIAPQAARQLAGVIMSQNQARVNPTQGVTSGVVASNPASAIVAGAPRAALASAVAGYSKAPAPIIGRAAPKGAPPPHGGIYGKGPPMIGGDYDSVPLLLVAGAGGQLPRRFANDVGPQNLLVTDYEQVSLPLN